MDMQLVDPLSLGPPGGLDQANQQFNPTPTLLSPHDGSSLVYIVTAYLKRLRDELDK